MVDLRDLGLSSYEERAYMALLDRRAGSASEIAAASDVPEGRIYDVLHELESRDLVHRSSVQRPRVYRAVDPDAAIDRLAEARTQELSAERSRIQQVAAELRSSLGGPHPMDGRFWATETRENEVAFVHDQLDRFAEATDGVLIVGDTTLVDQFSGETADAARAWLDSLSNSSLTVRILVSDRAVTGADSLVDTFGGSQRLRALPLEIRTHSAVAANFDLIDGDELYLYVSDPFVSSRPIGTVRVDERELIEEIADAFAVHWEAGTALLD